MVLRIDAEFQKLIPPLSKEEQDQLEEDIVAHGCLDPLKVWAGQDIILDGHHRYAICQNIICLLR